MRITEAVLILAGGAGILAIAFAIRVGMRSLGQAATPGSPEASDVPGVIAPPPLFFLGFLAAAALLEAFVPMSTMIFSPLLRYLLGGLLFTAGVLIGLAGARRFRAAGTNIPPTLPTTALVADGPYQWSRNPLYLAMMLIYGGLAVAAGSVWAFALVVPLFFVIDIGVVAREERYLERKFGDAYRQYKMRVRRWI
jgi:protein-S-isoprenylcysteine O-methyltransferase Ste14